MVAAPAACAMWLKVPDHCEDMDPDGSVRSMVLPLLSLYKNTSEPVCRTAGVASAGCKPAGTAAPPVPAVARLDYLKEGVPNRSLPRMGPFFFWKGATCRAAYRCNACPSTSTPLAVRATDIGQPTCRGRACATPLLTRCRSRLTSGRPMKLLPHRRS